MRILFIIFYLGAISSIAQTKVFDQVYYAVIKNKTIRYEQINDLLYVVNCKEFEKCDSLKNSGLFIERDSTIDDNSRMLVLKNQNYKPESEVFQGMKIHLVDYKNGRKAITDKYKKNNKQQLVILYPKSELIKLKPITQITQTESKEILQEFTNYINSIDKDEFDFDDFANWEKFNELVIKSGYNPIRAEYEIGEKLK